MITQAIVQLAHHLGAKIVAEGVESANQLESLQKWGCDAAQGYLFSPPLPTESLGKLLRDPLSSDGIRMIRGDGRPPLPLGPGPTPQPITPPINLG